MTVSELSPEKLRLECPPDQVGCETSAELGPVDGIIGQDRALKALKFGVEMKGKGFQKDMKNLVDQAKRAIPAALQNEEFVSRGNTITKKAVAERNKILSDLNKQAEVHGYTVRM